MLPSEMKVIVRRFSEEAWSKGDLKILDEVCDPRYTVGENGTLQDLKDAITAFRKGIPDLMGWSRFIGLQIPYSLLDRAVERDLLPMARHWDMAVLPWGLLEAGILTGKFLNKVADATRLNPEQLKLSEKSTAVVQEVQKIAAETGYSAAQVAINWVRQQPAAQMIPILGARTAEQLKDNLAVIDWKLTPEQWTRLNEVATIDLGFPHGFLDNNRNIFGATRDLIDSHRV